MSNMKKMKRTEIVDKIKRIRGNAEEFISNLIYSKLEDDDYSVICTEDAIAILYEDRNRVNAFYAGKNPTILKELLIKLPSNVYIETFHPEEKDDLNAFLPACGFDTYEIFVRVTVTWINNPFEAPEEGRRKVLFDMYDSNMGEFPEEGDAEELYKLCQEKFDPMVDDIFSLEEWKDIIAKKECMIVRENGRIVTLYKWRLEGKKLYINTAINDAPANYLYNLERKVYKKYWDAGIRVTYAWFNVKNKKALNRGPKKNIKSMTKLYNSIYIKK